VGRPRGTGFASTTPAQGRLYTRDGTHVVSVVQEGLVRLV
jgi:acyl-CoA thioesterase